ncbi:serine hydrolase [Mariprofundus ferrooxydans]|uniref:Beta-lactamase enzyme family protein n=1 Tax=Mariprofundus ferrooxydans PV-1 TaxID=314345 RepID=Q0F0F7_9PROT|nr:serine hydrolase [Mariprofundus ferrooxydans]EAU55071.1 hypothetical protein SPV1_06999 [Mariprofundus ferrooxydans PV-1]KON46887.1 hypothetical protein AL013_10890 [Mariprofundus ferrooxydans]
MIRLILFVLALSGLSGAVSAYPLDGADQTGISRLEGYRLAQQGKVPGNRLPPGALLSQAQVQLRLQGVYDDHLLTPDPMLTNRVLALLGADADHYSISVLDLSDPAQPRYAEHNGVYTRNPGSVGKLVIALALFQALADIYPDDTAARERLLHNSMIVANEFIRFDHHKAPFWQPEHMRLLKRKIVEGDTANYWTWLDWMLSASSNAAASMVLEHVLLLRHFGRNYPVTVEQQRAWFNQTPKRELSAALRSALQDPLVRNGLNPNQLRQGGFFSREGKRRVPGTNSVCSTRELMRYLLLMEQGRLVDAWSSLQIKRLLYMTQRRIRYASSPALKDAAVYFKSGSFYKCKPEEGFVCGKYKGNSFNLMNSVAIIESPAGAPRLDYMVTVTSNVLKKNSALDHQRLATRLHALLRSLHGVQP